MTRLLINARKEDADKAFETERHLAGLLQQAQDDLEKERALADALGNRLGDLIDACDSNYQELVVLCRKTLEKWKSRREGA